MHGWKATARHGVARKRSTKRLKHTENLFRKNLQLIGVFLDLKPYPKTRITEPSDGFLYLRETSLDKIWEVEHFKLFFYFSGCWFSGLELRVFELFKCPQYWKRDVNLP